MSRSFTHFAKLVAPSEKISFKSLRKTYITKLQIYSGGRAKESTGHSGNEVIEKHYVDQELVAFSVKNFEVFPEKEVGSENEKDLGKIREKSTKGKGISK